MGTRSVAVVIVAAVVAICALLTIQSLRGRPMRDAHQKNHKREQAIYDAVHEVLMQLRIRFNLALKSNGRIVNLDTQIAQAQHQAGMAAVAAYRAPLARRKSHA